MTQSGPDPDERPWPAEMTRATGKQVKRFRTDKWRTNRMSADALAAAVTELGLPYTRAQVTNLEAGRRTSITIGEVLAIAAVLEVPPVLLAFPFDTERTAEYLPGRTADAWSAAQWFMGDTPVPDWQKADPVPTVVGGRPQRFARYAAPVELYRDHDRYLKEWRRWSSSEDQERDHDRADTAEAFLSRTRDYMRELSIQLPDLPAELAHIDRDVWT